MVRLKSPYGRRIARECRGALAMASARVVHRLLGRALVVRTIHGFRMRLPIDPLGMRGLPESLIRYGTREEDQVHLVRDALRPGMVVADVGANIGYYTLLAASLVGKNGRVYAIEPASENLRLLVENVELNAQSDTVEVFQFGISEAPGRGQLHLSELRNCHAFLPDRPHPRSVAASRAVSEEVELVDFTTFAESRRPIDFVRMDIEGYEVKVLRGMHSYIERTSHPMRILFEAHRSRYGPGDLDMRRELAHFFDNGFGPDVLIAKPLNDSKPWGRHPFTNRGYAPERVISADGFERSLFRGITRNDALDYVCDIGCVRALLVSRPSPDASGRPDSPGGGMP
ncbi:MAG: FkbM family methyltransferase [Acidobacteriota bacterium]